MTERLDRIEALLLATAERQNEMNATLQQTQTVLNQTAQQQARNTDEIDTLLGAVSTNEVGVRTLSQTISELSTRIDESNQRFDILRAEAITDRQAARESAERWQSNFDAQLLEVRAQGEQIRALLSALANTNGRVNNLEQAS